MFTRCIQMSAVNNCQKLFRMFLFAKEKLVWRFSLKYLQQLRFYIYRKTVPEGRVFLSLMQLLTPSVRFVRPKSAHLLVSRSTALLRRHEFRSNNFMRKIFLIKSKARFKRIRPKVFNNKLFFWKFVKKSRQFIADFDF